MKKLVFSCLLLIASLCNAQKFELTPDNFKNVENKDQNFAVIEFTGQTQSELFKKTKLYIHSKYKNLKGEGFNEIDPDQIVLTLREFGAMKKILGIQPIGGDFTNRYEINFKDGKVMIKPYFVNLELPDGSGSTSKQQVFKDNGKLRVKEYFFDAIQNKTNEFVAELTSALNKSPDW